MNKFKRKNGQFKDTKGITLIALVVTVIILLILVGVSIATLSGQNGFLTKAQEAKTKTELAEIEEARALTQIEAATNTNGTTFKGTLDGQQKTVKIPSGFAVSQVKEENLIDNGLVIIDTDGNEFVWIPVLEENYIRNKTWVNTNVSNAAYDDNDTESYLPDGITNEKETVGNAEGFYISRYEAGKPDGAVNGITAPISKKGTTVWTNISYGNGDIKKSAKTMYNNSSVKSSVLTGIQWDITMAFINGKSDGNGTIYNVRSSNPTRHVENSLAMSGNNIADKVLNIYDLEGNAFEYVAEKSNFNVDYLYIHRGGSCTNGYSASNRYDNNGRGYTYTSFRIVLYV